jgi:hypothetical protein
VLRAAPQLRLSITGRAELFLKRESLRRDANVVHVDTRDLFGFVRCSPCASHNLNLVYTAASFLTSSLVGNAHPSRPFPTSDWKTLYDATYPYSTAGTITATCLSALFSCFEVHAARICLITIPESRGPLTGTSHKDLANPRLKGVRALVLREILLRRAYMRFVGVRGGVSRPGGVAWV